MKNDVDVLIRDHERSVSDFIKRTCQDCVFMGYSSPISGKQPMAGDYIMIHDQSIIKNATSFLEEWYKTKDDKRYFTCHHDATALQDMYRQEEYQNLWTIDDRLGTYEMHLERDSFFVHFPGPEKKTRISNFILSNDISIDKSECGLDDFIIYM